MWVFLARGVRDRAFGIEPEWKYTDVKHHLAYNLRYERQFGVQSRTSGNIVVIGITYVNFFSPK